MLCLCGGHFECLIRGRLVGDLEPKNTGFQVVASLISIVQKTLDEFVPIDVYSGVERKRFSQGNTAVEAHEEFPI